MKIIDIINTYVNGPEQRVSFEYFAPKGPELFDKLYKLADAMLELKPLFLDVTWGTGDPNSTTSIDVAYGLQKRTKHATMLHIPSCHLTTQRSKAVLDKIKDDGVIHNIFALTGNPDGKLQTTKDVIKTATDLVTYIRKHYGDSFCIGVSGYPDGHLNQGQLPDREFCHSLEFKKQLNDLKIKVDAGADFIITQLLFELDNVARFRDHCAKLGIHCPIIPGLLPINNAFAYKRVAKPSAVMPKSLSAFYDNFDFTDTEGLIEFSADLLLKQLDRLKAEGFNIVQIFTMNQNAVLNRALKA